MSAASCVVVGLLAPRLLELASRQPELLEQPIGLALLDRAGLLVVAEQYETRAGRAADLQHAQRLAVAELARLVEHENMPVGDTITAAREQRGERAGFDARLVARVPPPPKRSARARRWSHESSRVASTSAATRVDLPAPPTP
jgi:hypothetical protein